MNFKYKPEYCEQLKRHMSKGYSMESFAGDIGVTRTTLYNWCSAYPEFQEAKDVGLEKSLKRLESNLLRTARTGKGNVIANIFLLKNKFPNEWRDKREIEPPKENDMQSLSLEEQIARVEMMREKLLQLKSSRDTSTFLLSSKESSQ